MNLCTQSTFGSADGFGFFDRPRAPAAC
jgi:hypothetical protein